MQALINTFSSHYRHKHGQPVGKLPIDTGYPCPNRAKGGCIFCKAESFTARHLSRVDCLEDQIQLGKKNLLAGRFPLYFGYFQQETCTAAPIELLLQHTKHLLQDPMCVGIIFSTRPDCIADDFLAPLADLIQSSGKECHFELGLQSSHEKSLIQLNRNHTVDDFDAAVKRIQRYNTFLTGAHLIFGIPGETADQMIETVQYVNSLNIDTLKLHHLQVIRGTRLEELYHSEKIVLFKKDEYIRLLLQLIPFIPSHIIIHRLWAHSHPDLLVAPRWNILPGLLSAELHEKMKKEDISQGCRI